MSTNNQERTRLVALVRGRVQGVGYRFFAVDAARNRGLEGYARNLPDGRTVEVVVEGPRGALEPFVEVLRRGPRGAHVEAVSVSWAPPTGDLGPFDVRY